ncbi:hypothetical protein D6D25_01529 [Aureobasidium pullulans]|nr:hypothetical protein D6D25_01529 [Aureobasidium pullulans]
MKDEQSDPGGIWRLKQSANLRHITAVAQPSDSFHERMAEHAASIMKEQLPLVELALSIWRTAANPADPAPAGRRRRNARPRTEAQLQRMQQKEAYLERRRETKVGLAEENARKLRFKRHAQIAIFWHDHLAGTEWPRPGSLHRPGSPRQPPLQEKGTRWQTEVCQPRRNSLQERGGHEEAKKQATDRFMRARAPERTEEQGWLSKAEAEMAARHSGARVAAAGPAGSVATDEQKTARLAAEAICTAFEDAYDTDASQAALCHGANFFMAHRNSFPNGFNSAYLDLFLATYAEAMTFKPERRRNLAKTGTIEAQRAFPIPSDFSNWDTWFPDRGSIPSIPYSCIPRVGVRVKDDEFVDRAILKLRRTQRLLNDHMDDVVVFFVWKEICRAAVSQDYGKMEVLLVDAKSVKYGTQ